jgi:phospholipase A1
MRQVALILIAGSALVTVARAENEPQATLPAAAWQSCITVPDATARLACFDRWAARQSARPAATTAADVTPAVAPVVPMRDAPLTAPTTSPDTAPAPAPTVTAASPDCRSGPQSTLSRYWELEAGSDCGRFNIRGYKPISLSVIGSDSVNTAPSSPTAGHTASYQPYLQGEMRIQLSVRTKLASGFLTHGDPVKRDSLWFGYSQQSYWQLFNEQLSRPFRNTDHEPELMYIVPTDADLPGGWKLRYSGLSLNHQSNGQTLPLSRSWNRVIAMAGAEKDDRYTLTGRVWYRLPETADSDDNPGISDYVGRAEVTGLWNLNKRHTLGVTLRHSLMAAGNGSVRLDWLRAIGEPRRSSLTGGLRFHVQLFSGYGDSLLDYNRQRTVLSIGLSLVDW